MIVGFFLPLVLYWWWSKGWWPESSMSFYYYSGARDVFVGALCAIGVYLILIKPTDRIENFLLNVAGLAACAIALFPMKQAGDCSEDPGSLPHSISAFVFFGAISLVCFRFPAKDKTWRNGTRWCAGAMMLSVVIAVLYYELLPRMPIQWDGKDLKGLLCDKSIVFFIEAAAVWAFAFYWHFMSRDMEDSLSQLLKDFGEAALKTANAALKTANAALETAKQIPKATLEAGKRILGKGSTQADQVREQK
jgi:hypothetical protein